MEMCRKTILFFLFPLKILNFSADFSKVDERTEISKKNCFKLLIKCFFQLDEIKRLKSESLWIEKKYFILNSWLDSGNQESYRPLTIFSQIQNKLVYIGNCATKQHWCAVHNFPKIESGLTYSSSSVLLVLLALVLILPVVSWASLLKLLWVTLVVSVLSESFISAQSYFEIQTKEHWCISFV